MGAESGKPKMSPPEPSKKFSGVLCELGEKRLSLLVGPPRQRVLIEAQLGAGGAKCLNELRLALNAALGGLPGAPRIARGGDGPAVIVGARGSLRVDSHSDEGGQRQAKVGQLSAPSFGWLVDAWKVAEDARASQLRA